MDGGGHIGADEAQGGKPATQAQIKRAMEVFAEPKTAVGVFHFLLDMTLYSASIAGVLFVDPLWAKIVFSIYAGIKLANLGTLAHEAAHGNLARSPLANKIMGVILFLPCFYNYRLWVYDHHHIHHPYVNADQTNSWAPFSKAQFDALPAWRRGLERLYRNSFGLGLAPYNAIARWAPYHVIPGSFLPKPFRASSWRHSVLLLSYMAAFIALLATAPLYSNTSAVTALILGLAVPFYLWMLLFGFTVYVQHTDKRLPWFDGAIDRRTGLPQESMSLHLEFPSLLRALMHNVYEHAVHHVNVRIPYHRAFEAQAKLNEMSPGTAVVQKFTLKWLHETLRDCRLYDYDNHRWLDFDGKPTGPETITVEQRAKVRMAKAGTKLVHAA